MSDFLLSVCIATRNRCHLLADTVCEFLRQADGLPIEVVVVDGASTDATADWLKIAKDTANGHLRYESLAINGGIDRDYDHCVKIASGRYCWLFSDDDLPLPGAVEELLRHCMTDQYDCIYVDAEIWCVDLRSRLVARRLNSAAMRNKTTTDLDELFVWTAAQLCFIGSCVIRREFWLSRDRETYFGTYFTHVAVIFQSVLARTALVISDPLIKIRAGNASWSVRSAEIWMVLWPTLLWSLKYVSDDSKRQVISRYPWRNPIQLLWLRAKGQFTWLHYRNVVCKCEPSKFCLLVPGFVALLPASLVALAAALSVRIYKPDNHYLMYEVIVSGLLPRWLLKLIVGTTRLHLIRTL